MKLLTEYYDTFEGKVLPIEKFKLFSDLDCAFTLDEGFDASLISERDRDNIMKLAENNLEKPYPQLLASDFIRYYRYGDRKIFEGHYFQRRHMLLNFAFAEAVEGKGRFTDRIMDGVALVCDEYDWVIPAHIGNQYALNPHFKDHHPYIDLFAAETGSTLAIVYTLAKSALESATPMICERLLYCLHERITRAFLENKMYWMGLDGGFPNNWNPWILSNVLLVCALTENDTSVREAVVDRVVKCVDNFINGYHSDGGCDEGPSYWTAAGASLFDTLEILYDMTGGYVDLFGNELIRRMGEYEANFNINGDYFINFADCPTRVSPSYRLIMRYGRRVGSKMLEDFGALRESQTHQNLNMYKWELYRVLKSLVEPVHECSDYKPAKQSWYDGICVMIEREYESPDKGFFLACKGGHNNESHNHNDVGSFIVYDNGEPLLIDAGVGAYTKKTFSGDRYKIWSMRSDYHNLPTINGAAQLPGGDRRAEDVVYNKDAHSLSMDISKAYPESAGIESLRRETSLVDGIVKVTDNIKLENAGSAVFTLMCANKPDISELGVIKLSDTAELHYSGNLTAELDDFDVTMEDDSIKNNWRGYELNRVLLKSGEFTDEIFEITVVHK
ncbi:MAG: hypothetical protein HFE63_02660 [Clostridiales bacterium]|nr:hypothetical protein [Clostridiales bacterium]